MENNFDFTVNLNDIDTTQLNDFGLLEPKEYEVECTEVVGKPTKSGNGFMWAATFTVLDTGKGIYGRKLWHNFNVVNQSVKAQSIARAELKKLLAAKNIDLAKAQPTDLLGIKVMANVVVKSDPNYGTKNEIKAFIVEAPESADQKIPF